VVASIVTVLIACASITFPLRVIARSSCKAKPSLIGPMAVTASFGVSNGNAAIAAMMAVMSDLTGIVAQTPQEISL
jgi:hypothetical protein